MSAVHTVCDMDSGIELPIGHGKPPVSEYSLPRDGGDAASVGEQEAPAEVQETAELSGDRTGQRLVSTQTVQHDYLTLGGRVARETITTDGTVTAVLDFIYDSQGNSCCNSGSVVACAARSSIALLLLLAVMESHYEPKHDPRSMRKRLRTLRGFLPPIPIWLLEAISVHISRLGNSFLATRNIRFALFTARMLKGHSYSGHHRLRQLQKAAALEKE